VLLHRYLLGYPDGSVDHIDNDPLNNTRENLRICNHQQNCNNKWILNKNRRSVFKGLLIQKNGDIQWQYEDKRMKISYSSPIYFSQKFAYNDYCEFKKQQIGEFFQYRELKEFSLEVVKPRRARIMTKNKLGYFGVSPMTPGRDTKYKYRATIKINNKQKTIGYYNDAIEAAKAYDKASFEKNGYIAFVNFPDDFVIFL
jgi:hypothetical protein